MFKKTTLITIVVLMLNLAVTPYAFGKNSTNSGKEAKLAKKVKKGISKLGVGKNSKVRVKLKDGTKIKGYISEINESSFTVTKKKTGEKVIVSYSNAKQIKGNNLSSNVIVGIGVIAFILVIFYLAGKAS